MFDKLRMTKLLGLLFGGLARFGAGGLAARKILVRRGVNIVLGKRLGVTGQFLPERGDLFDADRTGVVAPSTALVGENVSNLLLV